MNPNLDMVRAAAVLMVVGSHLWTNLMTDSVEAKAVGRVGVAIFFVHTCYVLMLSLERTGGGALPFYVRRAFRIYPLAVAVVCLIALGNWLGGSLQLDALGVLANLALVQNMTGHPDIFGPLWSLPYEVQMYLFLPALYLVARRGDGAARIASVLAAFVLVLVGAMAFGIALPLLAYVPCFLPGVLAYAMPRRGSLSPAWLAAFILLAPVAVAALAGAGVPRLPLLWATCLALGLAIPACRELRAPIIARPAQVVAKYSYGIYLTHLFAIGVAFKLVPLPAVVSWAVFAFALAAWARVAYRWIEAPGVALGVRLADRTRAPQAEVIARP